MGCNAGAQRVTEAPPDYSSSSSSSSLPALRTLARTACGRGKLWLSARRRWLRTAPLPRCAGAWGWVARSRLGQTRLQPSEWARSNPSPDFPIISEPLLARAATAVLMTGQTVQRQLLSGSVGRSLVQNLQVTGDRPPFPGRGRLVWGAHGLGVALDSGYSIHACLLPSARSSREA